MEMFIFIYLDQTSKRNYMQQYTMAILVIFYLTLS